MRKLPPAVALIAALAALAAPAGAGAGTADTVTISGRAYTFNHMSDYIEGATIKVREIPGLGATTDASGDYTLEVPDDSNVTPYIDPPDGWNEIDLQTFHTRGEDIENANFQTPADLEYNALAAILSVPIDEATGRPAQCVIVTTASARNVRGVDYETFHERTPHGVPGATSEELPALEGPVYFNEHVIPDRTKTETSEDGGIIWSVVPAGTYRIVTTSPSTRFASFLATCRDGRIVNANPPWGAYELAAGEQPLGASVVAASVAGTKIRSGERRKVVVGIESGEATRVNAVLRKQGRRIGHARVDVGTGAGKVRVPVRRRAGMGRARLSVRLRDAAGDRVTSHHRVVLPPR
ncbi:MAG: hypothetical protein EDQ89_05045 [Acidobacteria bacterium]|nr:MAG: hypothetical protein EDQ89_05045 [Acidobacteriota bacterium]GIK78681.1 MAG: hypothetical protein BroJett022_23710 [Actinomycetes bacterium]